MLDGRTLVLGISGSPRGEASCSEKMLKQFLCYVKKHGGETRLLRLKDKRIFPCEGCYSETKSGEKCSWPCIHDGQDKTTEVLETIIEADSVVISSNVEWGNVSSLLAILRSKMTCVENNSEEIKKKKGKDPFSGKPLGMIFSQDSEGASLAYSSFMWGMMQMGFLIPPYGCIFKPSILNKSLAKIGLRVMGYRKLEWIDTTMESMAWNMVQMPRLFQEHNFNLKGDEEPRC
ncbi:MAG TPA: flavodoxin family protein [Candidatus Moranbacteria bacterium]|nr:flavodoxin family protein [Candidatus Moranbacteria bacterium]